MVLFFGILSIITYLLIFINLTPDCRIKHDNFQLKKPLLNIMAFDFYTEYISIITGYNTFVALPDELSCDKLLLHAFLTEYNCQSSHQ